MSVSYTHLDVYKRQGLRKVVRVSDKKSAVKETLYENFYIDRSIFPTTCSPEEEEEEEEEEEQQQQQQGEIDMSFSSIFEQHIKSFFASYLPNFTNFLIIVFKTFHCHCIP